MYTVMNLRVPVKGWEILEWLTNRQLSRICLRSMEIVKFHIYDGKWHSTSFEKCFKSHITNS
jgi:hypothetical protein